MKTAIIVNMSANDGAAGRKWESIKEDILASSLTDASIFELYDPFEGFSELVHSLLQDKYDCFISGGGDGSLNHLLNTIIHWKGERITDIYLGAIGLGSSNDFLKRKSRLYDKISARINTHQSNSADIGKVIFKNSQNNFETRFFLINASVGVVSDANYAFNKGDFFIDRTKSWNVDLAILYTAIKTILRYRNKEVEIQYKKCKQKIQLTNLSVIKSPHISGSFQYDQDIKEDDGYLGLNYCKDMNTFELFQFVSDLEKKKFTGKQKRYSEFADEVRVTSGDYLNLELDGEVFKAKDIVFSIIPKAIHILGV